MKITDYLERIGLSDLEAKLYLNLLQAGALTVRELARATGVNRTSAYDYVEALIEKGLVSKIVRGTKKQVVANAPEDGLRPLVQTWVQTANELQSGFPEMLSQLPQRNDSGRDELKYYKGRGGVRKIYEEALKAKEVRSYVNLSEMGGLFPENSDIFIEAFKRNCELKIFEIFEDSPQSKIAIQNQANNERFFYKFHPKEITLSAADTVIFDGNVGIINVRNDLVSGIILRNTEYYNNLKEFFDFIWKMLPEAK